MADLEFSRSSYERAIRELKKEKFLVYVKTIGINYQYNFYECPLNIIEDGLIHIGGIYAIYDKETNEVLYVGKTEKEFNKREKEHILKLKKGESYPYKEMKENGYNCENIYFSLIYDFSKNPIEHKDVIYFLLFTIYLL